MKNQNMKSAVVLLMTFAALLATGCNLGGQEFPFPSADGSEFGNPDNPGDFGNPLLVELFDWNILLDNEEISVEVAPDDTLAMLTSNLVPWWMQFALNSCLNDLFMANQLQWVYGCVAHRFNAQGFDGMSATWSFFFNDDGSKVFSAVDGNKKAWIVISTGTFNEPITVGGVNPYNIVGAVGGGGPGGFVQNVSEPGPGIIVGPAPAGGQRTGGSPDTGPSGQPQYTDVATAIWTHQVQGAPNFVSVTPLNP